MMYEVEIYNWLEDQYKTLLEKGFLEVQSNWEKLPPKRMKSKDKKLYETLLTMFINDYYALDHSDLITSFFTTSSQKMIINFFHIVMDYAQRCDELTKDLDPNKKENEQKVSEIIGSLALTRSALKSKLTKGLSISKRWKVLKELNCFESMFVKEPEPSKNS